MCRLASALAVLLAVALGPPLASASTTPYVSASMPVYESPGGLVPAIITVWFAPAGYEVSLDAVGLDGASAQCVGEVWFNPVRDSHSRTCYLQIPLTPGEYGLAVTATLTGQANDTVLVTGNAARPVKANGYPSSEPISIATAQEIERCGNATDDVWLTFDDSINPSRLPTVMQILAANNVKATFFLTGKFRDKWPHALRVIRRQGHLLGNHTYSHVALSKTSDAAVLSQIDRGVKSNTSPKLLRPPYGAGAFTSRLRDLAAQRSYALCRWTTVPYDWEASATADLLVERVRYGDYRTAPIEAGGVVLLHGHGDHMVEGLQGIIDAIRARGLSLRKLH